VEGSDGDEDDNAPLYQPNSLLAQVAEIEKAGRVTNRVIGPYINTANTSNNQNFYGQNSLLALADQRKSTGPLMQKIQGSSITPGSDQQPFRMDGPLLSFQNSIDPRMAEQAGLLRLIGQNPEKKVISGPLIGNLKEMDKKPKFESGLVGQMQRMELERDWMKKNALRGSEYYEGSPHDMYLRKHLNPERFLPI
jgi:hypothetical protein